MPAVQKVLTELLSSCRLTALQADREGPEGNDVQIADICSLLSDVLS